MICEIAIIYCNCSNWGIYRIDIFKATTQDNSTLTFLPVSQKGLEVDYHLLLLISKVTTFDPWPEVISPSQPATLTASKQPWKHHSEGDD